MSFRSEVADFVGGFKAGQEFHNAAEDRRYRRALTDYTRARTENERAWRDTDAPGQPNPFGGSGPSVTTETRPGGGSTSQGATDVAWKGASPEQRALLNTIAGTESPDYNVLY